MKQNEFEGRSEVLAKREAKKEAKKLKKNKSEVTDSSSLNKNFKSNETEVTKQELEKNVENVSEKNPVKTILTKQFDFNFLRLFNNLKIDTPSNKNEMLIVSNSTNLPIFLNFQKLYDLFDSYSLIGATYRARSFLNAIIECLDYFKIILETKKPNNQYEILKKFDIIKLNAYFNDCLNFLKYTRSISIAMDNIMKYIEDTLLLIKKDTHEMENIIDQLRSALIKFDHENIATAKLAIISKVISKIHNDDFILTYGHSSLICDVLLEATKKGKNFSVIIVDSKPLYEGKELLNKLTSNQIHCCYIDIAAVGCLMQNVQLVLLGAHGILCNGTIMSRTGTAQVALIAKSFNSPVLVCCETYKFSSNIQFDSFHSNEIVKTLDCNGHDDNVLSLMYDVTPADFITGVVTEIGIIPCTSVSIINRRM